MICYNRQPQPAFFVMLPASTHLSKDATYMYEGPLHNMQRLDTCKCYLLKVKAEDHFQLVEFYLKTNANAVI